MGLFLLFFVLVLIHIDTSFCVFPYFSMSARYVFKKMYRNNLRPVILSSSREHAFCCFFLTGAYEY